MSVVDSNLTLKRSERLYQKQLLNDLKANLASEKLPDQTKYRDARVPTPGSFMLT